MDTAKEVGGIVEPLHLQPVDVESRETEERNDVSRESTEEGNVQNNYPFFLFQNPRQMILGAFTAKVAELVDILGQQEARHLTDIKFQAISEFVKVSLFEGLSLSEYVLAKNVRCEQIHNCHNTCMKCSSLINAAKLGLKENVIPLFTSGINVVLTCLTIVQLKFLHMPVSAVTVNGAVYITEKKETHMD